MKEKYFVQFGDSPEKEVSKKRFIEIEESCDFFSKFDGEPATDGFFWEKGKMRIEGRIQDE